MEGSYSNVDEQEYLCYIFYVEREDAWVYKIAQLWVI